MAKRAKLGETDLIRLRADLGHPPPAFGLSNRRWTGAALARHLARTYSVSFSPRYCRSLLIKLGAERFSPAPRNRSLPTLLQSNDQPGPRLLPLSDSQLKARASRRIARLANSGLPLYQYVQTLFDVVSDAVPNNDVKVMGFGQPPGEQWISRNLDHAKWGPLLQDLMLEAPPEVSGVVPLAQLRCFAAAQPVVTSEQFQNPGYFRSQAYHELGLPIGLHYGIMVPLKNEGEVFATYCLWRKAGFKPFSRTDSEFLALSARHIAHGLANAKMLTLPDGNGLTLATMADWPTAVVLMRPDGRIEGLNQAAKDIFQRLGAFDRMPLDAFGAAGIRSALDYVARVLRDAFAAYSGIDGAIPAVAVYPHESGIILRLRAFAIEASGEPMRFVVLVERGETEELKRRRLMARFGLSAREFDSISALAAGRRPVEISRRMQVSQESVRSYFYRAMDKLALRDLTALEQFVEKHLTPR